MTDIKLVVPDEGTISLDALESRLARSLDGSREPFSEEVLSFASALSSLLFTDVTAKQYPELRALGFFMRRARLMEFRSHFSDLQSSESLLLPRGVVFHVPPRNVSSITIYSWLMSALVGNINIIRVSTSSSPELETIIRLYNDLIESWPGPMRTNTLIIRFEHNDDVTRRLSALADVRVIWGGDDTVNRLRAIPLPPAAKEVTFPDRHSLAVISASRYSGAEPSERDRLTGRFYNDLFWFDQTACSSPRVLVWLGPETVCREASADFLQRLSSYITRSGYNAALGAELKKRAFSCAAILDQGVTSYQRFGNELTVLDLPKLETLTRAHCGGGLLFQHCTSDWDELVRFVARRDQTLTYYGLSPGELSHFARKLNGRGIDRIVPVGQALNFDYIWDGYDLLQEFTRRTHIVAERHEDTYAHAK
jgi:hypothetical protein